MIKDVKDVLLSSIKNFLFLFSVQNSLKLSNRQKKEKKSHILYSLNQTTIKKFNKTGEKSEY